MVNWWFSFGATICMEDCWLKQLFDMTSIIQVTINDFMKAILNGDFGILSIKLGTKAI